MERRLHIIEIQKRKGYIITLSQNIKEELVYVFMDQVKEIQSTINYDMLGCINKTINEE